MAPPKFKAPTIPNFFHFFFALVPAVQQALTIFCRIDGSVVEFSPATELYTRASRSMAPPKYKAPTFPHFFSFFVALVAALQQAFIIFCLIGGSVVEFSPATRETGVRFPANAFAI